MLTQKKKFVKMATSLKGIFNYWIRPVGNHLPSDFYLLTALLLTIETFASFFIIHKVACKKRFSSKSNIY